jgi:argininosuccinate lyase
MDEVVVTFNETLPFDIAFYKANIQASIAYAKALTCSGCLPTTRALSYKRRPAKYQERTGLQNLRDPIQPAVDEDTHIAKERWFSELIGPETAGKLHTSRSVHMLTTEVADYLAKKAVPFRQTHHLAWQLLRELKIKVRRSITES